MPYSFDFNVIVVSNNPRGRFESGIIVGTPKPGIVVDLKATTEPVNGVFSYVPYTGTDGNRPYGPVCVLCEDRIQGKGITDAYVTGTIGTIYFPLPGDLLLMQLQDVSGTGDAHTIREKLIIDSTTGQLLVTTGSPQCEPFCCMETIAAPTGDYWALVQFTGY